MAPAPTETRRRRTESGSSFAHRLAECHSDALTTALALVDRQDAEDIVQEATLRVLGAAARGASIEEPRAYLRAAVRHVAADHLRGTRGDAPLEDVPESVSPHADPQRALELREALQAIEDLPRGQRHALLATALTAHDQRRLAHLLETTPAGIRQLVRRARRRLRNAVGSSLPWLNPRLGDLLGALAPGSGARSGAVAVAVAAVIAPAAPSPPTPPNPAAPEPHPVAELSARFATSSSARTGMTLPSRNAAMHRHRVDDVTLPARPQPPPARARAPRPASSAIRP